jgi:diguanylate cyclase (GGDEF)-like protein
LACKTPGAKPRGGFGRIVGGSCLIGAYAAADLARRNVSFRSRLILFFALIAVLPVMVVALPLTRVAEESRTARTDADLTAGAETALLVFGDKLAAAAAAARAAARDDALAASLRSRNARAAQRATDRLVRELDLVALSARTPSGRKFARAGEPGGPGGFEVAVRGPGGLLGHVRAATLRPDRYVTRVSTLTGSEVALLRSGRVVATTAELASADLPEGEGAADIELSAGESRVVTAVPEGAGPDIRVAVLGPKASSELAVSQPLVIAGLLAFFALALFFVVLLVRALQGQVRAMLAAARRIGGGDFSHRVPVEGDDELAGLAREFNTMSERLAGQMAELRDRRSELERSVRRVGEAFAAGLDREALLEVAADAALAACDADSVRVTLTGPARIDAEAGDRPAAELGEAIREAGERALRDAASADCIRGNAFALAQPLPAHGARGRRAVMTIVRMGGPFDASQREMLRYLAGQTAVSLENIELQELVFAETVTDEVTGLLDSRRVRGLLEDEVDRAQRYGHELSLVLLGVDGLRRNGSTHAENALREVGQILDESFYPAGKPGRWGAQEFAVVLPETGVDGALELAERVRTAIEQARIPLPQRSGTAPLTASLGIATLPRFGGGVDGLLSVARTALDRARAGGGNRTEATGGATHAARP